ncbi:MAG: hypothetical protein KDD34_06070 [Bdellovibrionales bacterium]|nr:hypothetical protein [Bdellovibrionales bacterium]
MANRIERKIQRLLLVNKPQKDIFDELVAHLFQKKISEDERNSIFNFALNAGLYQELLATFVEAFHEKIPIPWGLYIRLLKLTGVTPNKEVIESVIKGAKRQNRVDTLALATDWESLDSRFKELRITVENDRHQKYKNKKQMLLDKVEFYRSQRMVDEEKRALKILLRMFPDDKDLVREYQKFEQEWAKEVISRSASETHESKLTERIFLNAEEQKVCGSILQQMQEICSQNNNSAYNFAIGLKFMGSPEAALKILEFADDTWEVEWLKIDLLIDSGRFVDCLSQVHDIELRYANDPETTFAATYARAKALNGLGQTGPAIDLLQSIVSVRPNYRSAFTLMTQWAGELL